MPNKYYFLKAWPQGKEGFTSRAIQTISENALKLSFNGQFKFVVGLSQS